MHKLKLVLLLSFSLQFVNAQFNHEPVLPELTGNALLQGLVDNYKTQNTFGLSKARDTLFSAVWGSNDTLRCVYTDFPRYMDPNEDPTQTVFNNGSPDGINTEHSYPRSKGAGSGNAESDMHHLFPTRVDVNGIRASHPFREIPDAQVTSWYYLDEKLNNIPSANIDAYSEYVSGSFEVRESFAGNVARAAFYFYTMYKTEADAADPDFFELQRADLCAWHFQDPVDEKEWQVTHKIASYQDGKVNPFVLDCSLASRTYCENISEACALTQVNDIAVNDLIAIVPNPIASNFKIITADYLQVKRMVLLNLKGQVTKHLAVNQAEYQITNLDPGFYFINVHTNQGDFVLKLVKI